MSKITIITASPRQDSNSAQMAKWLKEEAEQLGAEVKTFDAIQLRLLYLLHSHRAGVGNFSF